MNTPRARSKGAPTSLIHFVWLKVGGSNPIDVGKPLRLIFRSAFITEDSVRRENSSASRNSSNVGSLVTGSCFLSRIPTQVNVNNPSMSGGSPSRRMRLTSGTFAKPQPRESPSGAYKPPSVVLNRGDRRAASAGENSNIKVGGAVSIARRNSP